MANSCYNYVSLSFDRSNKMQECISFLKSYNEFDNLTQWGDSLFPDREASSDTYQYGTTWWDFTYEVDGDTISIYGDSAWSPPVGIVEALCELFASAGYHEFEEQGMDFAGSRTYVDGKLVDSGDYSYGEFKYETDPSHYMDEIRDNISAGCYDTIKYLIDAIDFMSEDDIEQLTDFYNNQIQSQ